MTRVASDIMRFQGAIIVGTANVPCGIVQNLEFQDLLRTLDRRYNVPSRALLTKELENVLTELKCKIIAFLQML